MRAVIRKLDLPHLKADIILEAEGTDREHSRCSLRLPRYNEIEASPCNATSPLRPAGNACIEMPPTPSTAHFLIKDRPLRSNRYCTRSNPALRP